jgi:hypothetical protein
MGPYGPNGAWCALDVMSDHGPPLGSGGSCVAARQLFLSPTMSYASVVKAASQCHEAVDVGGYKIVVTHDGG